MIKNFDEVKQQLRQLAEIVKSEAVQLRLVELVFSGSSAAAAADLNPEQREEEQHEFQRGPRRRRRAAVRKPRVDNEAGADSARGATATARPKARKGTLGPKAALSRMYDEGFFKGNKRTIGDIVQNADNNLAIKIKQSDISGMLARYVRDGKLTRTKNADNQYEYSQA